MILPEEYCMKHAHTFEESIDEGKTIFQVLSNVMDKWAISPDTLAGILHTHPTTVKKWIASERVPFKRTNMGAQEEVLLTFLRIDRYLSQMFANVEDQRTWLNSRHPFLQFVPLEHLQGPLENIFNLKNYLSWSVAKGA
jgi:hypothetical protein